MGRCDFKPGEKLNSRLETEQKKVRNFSVEFSRCCCTKSEQQQSEEGKSFPRELSESHWDIRKSSSKECANGKSSCANTRRSCRKREEKKRAKAGMENSRFCAVENARRRAHREGKLLALIVSVDVQHTVENVYVFITCSLPLSLLGWKVFFIMWSKGIFLLAENFLCVFMSPSFERFYDGRAGLITGWGQR